MASKGRHVYIPTQNRVPLGMAGEKPVAASVRRSTSLCGIGGERIRVERAKLQEFCVLRTFLFPFPNLYFLLQWLVHLSAGLLISHI